MSHVTGWLLFGVGLLAAVTHALPIERLEFKRFIHQSPINGPRVEQSIHENQFETQRFKRSIPEGYQYKKPYKDIVNQFEAPRFKRFIPESPFEAQEFKRSIPEGAFEEQEFKRSIPESAFEEQEFKRSIPEFYRPEQGRFALVAYPPEQSIVIGADAVFAGMQKRLTEITRERRAAPKSSFEAQRLKRSIPQSLFEGQRLSHSMLDNGVYINPKHSELGIVLTGLTREKRAASEAEGQNEDKGIVSSFKAHRSKRSIPKAKGFQLEGMRANIVAYQPEQSILLTEIKRERKAAPKSSFEGQRLKRSIPQSPFEGQRLRHSMLNKGVYINPKHSELGIVLTGLTRERRAASEGQYDDDGIVSSFKAQRSKRSIPKAKPEGMRASIVWTDMHRQRRATGSEDVRDFVGAGRKNLPQNSPSKLTEITRERRAAGDELTVIGRDRRGALQEFQPKLSRASIGTGDAVFAEMEKRGNPGIVSSVFKRQVQPVFKEKD